MSARHSLIPTTATAVTTATLTTTAASSSTTFTNFPVNSMLSLPSISTNMTIPNLNLLPTSFSPVAVSGDTAGDGTNTVPRKLSTAEALGSKNNTQSFQNQHTTKLRALNGITSTVKDKSVDFLCPVCFEIISEAHITRCGHTFCYTCIVKAIQTQGRCPKCNLQVISSDFIFPNYLLSELIAKYKRNLYVKINLTRCLNKHKLINKTDDNKHNNMNNINNNNNQKGDSSSGVGDDSDVAGFICDEDDDDDDHFGLKTFFKNESQKLNLDDVKVMLDILQQRKLMLESETNTAQDRLLYDFLKHLLNRKEQQERQIATELKIIRKDLTEVINKLKCIDNVSTTSTIPAPPPPPQATVQPCLTGVNNEPINNNDYIDDDIDMRIITTDNIINSIELDKPLLTDSDGFNSIKINSGPLNYLTRRQRMHSHFDDFVKSYFAIRSKDLFLIKNTINDNNQDNIISSDSGITVAASSANTAAVGEGATDATTATATVDVAAAAAAAAAAVNATATTKTLATDINVNDNSAMIIDGGDCSGDNTNPIKSNKNNDKLFIGGSGDINNNASSSSSNNKKPRINQLKLTTNTDNNTNNNNLKLNERKRGLDLFRDNLVKFSRYSTLRPLATMLYSTDLHTSSTIVSTIAFDKDNEFLAIGGVTKRIKIFDYLSVIRDTIQVHYPTVEMLSTSKIACLTWNTYQKNILASSDYEGAVNIWDVQTGQRIKCFHEHEKRCWSVDFNEVDTRLIASGSDDARVKLWSLNNESSIATLEAKANVCCVKFNPKSSCHLAFGSADHDVHYYDLRNMSKSLCIFKGHKKAVSYVKFLNSQEIISASTDSQLKLWNINSPPNSLRSFVGHVNEKNFIGLATDDDYIACGSEDNSIFIYYKGLSKRLINYKLDGTHRVTDIAGNLNISNMHQNNINNIINNNNNNNSNINHNININNNSGGSNNNNANNNNNNNANNNNNNNNNSNSNNDSNDFVSAVCWRKKSNVVVAANSRGIIKILELV